MNREEFVQAYKKRDVSAGSCNVVALSSMANKFIFSVIGISQPGFGVCGETAAHEIST